MTSGPLANPPAPGALLRDLFEAGVAAADPARLVQAALSLEVSPRGPVHVIAVGKAAVAMTGAAYRVADATGLPVAAGLVVAPDQATLPQVRVMVGDHPIPGPGSLAASEALGQFVAALPARSEVWLLLSGGATSLLAGPAAGVAPEAITATFGLLLRSGLGISAMNQVRKRITRWGRGALGEALAPRPVLQLVLSDVAENDLRAIGSGPAVPDPTPTRSVIEQLGTAGLWAGLPTSVTARLRSLSEAEQSGSPKLEFPHVRTIVIGDNATARQGAADRARALACEVVCHAGLIAGEAAAEGERIGRLLRATSPAARPIVQIWGGEPSVTIEGDPGHGGRAQELALAAARTLQGEGSGAALLVAGTDGRDGPTDAAGAIVDGTTWRAIMARGMDPDAALSAHDSYTALDSVGALFQTGATGTNVMDLMIGVRGP